MKEYKVEILDLTEMIMRKKPPKNLAKMMFSGQEIK